MESVHQVPSEDASQRALAEINTTNHGHQVNPGPHGERNNEGGSEEDESRVNRPEKVQNGHACPGDAPQLPGLQSGTEKQGQQHLGPVQWERFLPVKTLKVLLVENDDSTRQIVTALLRNCSYEVITAQEGLQAWKILQDQTNHIDLVLTEVVMPGLSGIGLLSKIMSHKTCKTVPVIMMSSNDSMGIVFKCLSKGAVDFLVKPIRKNELKILWQHVWRRCHSSSGSGSESGIQMQRCDKSNNSEDSDDNSGSSDDEENTSIRLNARDGSDNGSGTQSSWTKRAVEVDSPQPLSPSDQLADPPDSTCAQVIHPKAENYCDDWLPIATQNECDDEFMGKDLEIGVPGNLNSEHPNEMVPAKPADRNTDMTPDSDPKTEGVTDGSNTFDEPTTKAADLIGSITNCISAQQAATRVADAPNGFVKISDGKEKGCDEFAELPSLELSLKRLRSAGDCVNPSVDDRNVLRRSDSSAFTRYHTSTAASNQEPTGGYGGSCSPVDNSSEAVKTDLTRNTESNSNKATPIKQGSNEGSNNNDMGSTTKNVFTNCPATAKEKVSSPSAVKSNQHTSAFHPVQLRTAATAPAAGQQTVQAKSKEAKSKEMTPATTATTATTMVVPGQTREIYLEHHHHHHYHHIHHHHDLHGHHPPQPPMDCGMPVGSSGMTGTPSQTMVPMPVEGQAANYSMNVSNSGSNHGSNGQNRGGSTAAHAGGVNVESANIVAEKSGAMNGNGNGSGSGSGSCVYQDRLAQREAALNKFRQKRKERNFNKKVRYQSRKKLAEQRPRVRGQFVRQSVQHDHPERDAER
ncbi:two-component response regulator-like PRR37 isoform X2 [Carex littledalei]|uniref:Two-component response regulator-like PRR37 isoform X2 n=1 Tax=Carex littledalei TaxID=544730 RepID=A0A833QQU9_9POAL|nr:two-component response regulator-like PRR37 isoform X2 [Carex littledalei]